MGGLEGAGKKAKGSAVSLQFQIVSTGLYMIKFLVLKPKKFGLMAIYEFIQLVGAFFSK